MGLLTQRGAVNQKQDSLKTIGGKETVNHTQNRTGLASTGSHGNQCGLLAVNDGSFRSFDSLNLVIAEVQTVLIPKQVIL